MFGRADAGGRGAEVPTRRDTCRDRLLGTQGRSSLPEGDAGAGTWVETANLEDR